MTLKIAFAGALIAGFVLPGIAQAADEYYLVQDTKTKSCKIVEQKPERRRMDDDQPGRQGL